MPRMIRDDSGDRNGWWYGDRFFPFDAPEQIARLREELAAANETIEHMRGAFALVEERTERAERREREALAMLLECHSNNCCCDLYDDFTNINSQSAELRALLSRAREQEQSKTGGE